MLKHKFRALFLILTTAVIVSVAGCGKQPENKSIAETPAELAAESEQSTQDNRYETEAAPIVFQYLYRGFSPVPLESREEMEAFSNIGTKIITSEEDWSAYMGKYCPGIPYNVSVDFSDDCLIANVSSGARPTYIGSNTIQEIRLKDGEILMEFDDDPSGLFYALNNDKTAHFYVEILVVSRADVLPEAASYVYEP